MKCYDVTSLILQSMQIVVNNCLTHNTLLAKYHATIQECGKCKCTNRGKGTVKCKRCGHPKSLGTSLDKLPGDWFCEYCKTLRLTISVPGNLATNVRNPGLVIIYQCHIIYITSLSRGGGGSSRVRTSVFLVRSSQVTSGQVR